MKCIFCDNEFEQKQTGRTPKFCSAKCRVYFNRGIGVGENIFELEKEKEAEWRKRHNHTLGAACNEFCEKNLVPTELVEEEIDVRDVNKVTGGVYDTKEDKLAGLKAMVESVNQKYEAPLEPQARVDIEPLTVNDYIPSTNIIPNRPSFSKPNVPQPAKREVYFEGGEKVELIYEDNPL